ncbi:putative CDP-alcohol phosphatidyltransferase class-I family protein C22A12.08c [Ceratocystis fimbriata CBS 114723]|uniref:Putative CDP-alcohol phosphatidyltransferase class-I family protein C22A12.08c n=1 Tax=Ceratocystis fimbriata CBS 114723 TaxID=1035309 RepID=A0A2C5WZU2_9PEZI|nr:putative CDP-alcohol phosphatidyltransferase class-I family protein C22A12.08c [Ceratocystis fimbriata CBS 114723]
MGSIILSAACHAYRPGLTWPSLKLATGPALIPRILSSHRKLATASSSPSAKKAPSFAFAFDIDGVLLHVAKPIPGAAESLQYLTNNKIPFILLTNGGGKHESDRVSDLASKLGVRLSTENFVQSHTPFQDLVDNSEGLREKTILVTGADAHKCRQIAEAYGFRSVVTPADILAAQPNIYPFQTLMTEVYANTWRPLPKPLYNPDQPTADALKIDAVFVFNDPRDWSLDIQIITDILQSHNGIIGTYSPKNGKSSLPNNGWQGDGQPRVYFSNPDLLWAAHFHQPRLGQGAFQASLDGVWRAITGGHSLQRTVIGKPHQLTYEYAERVLNQHHVSLAGGKPGDTIDSLHNVYMVGDNPESDIRGANEFRSVSGAKWSSLLVRTGVWSETRGPPTHMPTAIVPDVREAVRWALKREGMEGL